MERISFSQLSIACLLHWDQRLLIAGVLVLYPGEQHSCQPHGQWWLWYIGWHLGPLYSCLNTLGVPWWIYNRPPKAKFNSLCIPWWMCISHDRAALFTLLIARGCGRTFHVFSLLCRRGYTCAFANASLFGLRKHQLQHGCCVPACKSHWSRYMSNARAKTTLK
jgi:hypothetical protein